MKRIIWILEDDDDLRDILTYLARLNGFEVVSFSSIQKINEYMYTFLEKISVQSLAPNIFLSDFHLQDGVAEQILMQVREFFVDCRVFCMSGNLNSELRKKLIQNGISIIDKPASLVEVFRLLEESSS